MLDFINKTKGMKWPITPVAKPRMTRADKWKKRPCVLKYWAFKDEIRLRGVSVNNDNKITFHIPMPKSWSETKKVYTDGAPHTSRPDLDNLVKALLDAIFVEDAMIHKLYVSKVWARKGAIEINHN